ncbi:LacI family DNA-binding transcriptional regulator [Kitasatospora sp. NPDC006697]|uniref:LacI family DNA-binding transcriptional regulator n=1 Tax=Kitasatospora sp. NPDC006697 TaxID=3364020 RepID=UPI0036AD000E
MTRSRITIRDVAARAGVSPGAVSMAVNNRPGLAEATRLRIRTAADELGWAPDGAARRLAVRRPGPAAIGLVITRPARHLGLEPFYMEFISGIQTVLQQRGSSLLLRLVADRTQETAVQRQWWRGQQIAGSILVDLVEDDPRVPVLSRLGIPLAAAGHPDLVGPGTAAVWTDDGAALQQTVRYLAMLGHRRIARVGGDPGLGHSAIRSRALHRAAAELELPEPRDLTTDFSGDQGARATRTLLSAPPGSRPTAIVYDNDIMAVAGLAVATEMGLRVPADLSLVAWDDSQLCRLTHPALSALSHDVHAFGAQAAQRLFEVIERRTPAARTAATTPVLLPRGSTGPAPL